MSWIQSALFYHIYPLGLCNAPTENHGGEPVSRIRCIHDWIPHLKRMHINAIYFSPLWESGTHGYDTVDYTTLDRRLGTNEDLEVLCKALHENGIRIVLDGVFNHVGRGFFAFQDLLRNKEQSQYRDWFCNLNFGGSNRFGDPFWYESWHGCEELVKLNLRNDAVASYLERAILEWIDRYDIDGIRFDAADCVDRDFFRRIRRAVKSRKPDCWLMGELIHGDYAQWANPEMLDSSTNYECWKGIWSSHNDKNYFEINYGINRQSGQHGIYKNLLLYNFADNHDVSRLASQLKDERHLPLVYALLYAMPGIPSVYYGSEFALKAEKRKDSDWNLRPALDIHALCGERSSLCAFLYGLGALYAAYPVLHEGAFATVEVRNQQLVFRRGEGDSALYCVLNLADTQAALPLPISGDGWVNLFTDTAVEANGQIVMAPCSAAWIAKKIENAQEDTPALMAAERSEKKDCPVAESVSVSASTSEPAPLDPVREAIVQMLSADTLPVEQLAQQSGVSAAMIRQLLHGDGEPTIGMLQQLADAKGLQMKLLFCPKESC